MSIESAIALIERLESDAELRRRFEETPTRDARYELAASAGYDVTREDLEAAAARTAPYELTEGELGTLSGGQGGFVPLVLF